MTGLKGSRGYPLTCLWLCWYVCHKRHNLQDPKLPIFHQCSRSFVLIVRKCYLQFTVNIQLCSPQDNLIFRRKICNFYQFQKCIQPDIIADTVHAKFPRLTLFISVLGQLGWNHVILWPVNSAYCNWCWHKAVLNYMYFHFHTQKNAVRSEWYRSTTHQFVMFDNSR